jgi:hypothetical protein
MLKQRAQTNEPKLENHKELPMHTSKLLLNQCNSPWMNACKPPRKTEQLLQLCSDRSDRLTPPVRLVPNIWTGPALTGQTDAQHSPEMARNHVET